MDIIVDSNKSIPLAHVKPGDIVKYADVWSIVTDEWQPSRTCTQLVSLKTGASIVIKDQSTLVQVAKSATVHIEE